MNAADPDSPRPPPPDAPAAAPLAPTAAASRWLVAAIALVLVAAGLFGWLDARRENNALRSDVAQRLGAADAALTQAKSKEAGLGNELRDVEAKLALIETRVAESQSQPAALQALSPNLPPTRSHLALTQPA